MTKPIFANNKNKYGQYFTPQLIVDYMISLSNINKNSSILEPSSGEGIFIDRLKDHGYKNIIAYEIDKQITINNKQVIYKSFISENIDKKFNLIIGNPPYIRWKNLENELKEELENHTLWHKYFNSLCDYSYMNIG